SGTPTVAAVGTVGVVTFVPGLGMSHMTADVNTTSEASTPAATVNHVGIDLTWNGPTAAAWSEPPSVTVVGRGTSGRSTAAEPSAPGFASGRGDEARLPFLKTRASTLAAWAGV